MCKVHKRRSRAEFGWREQREREDETGATVPPSVVINLTIDPESGGVVVETPVDIDLTRED